MVARGDRSGARDLVKRHAQGLSTRERERMLMRTVFASAFVEEPTRPVGAAENRHFCASGAAGCRALPAAGAPDKGPS